MDKRADTLQWLLENPRFINWVTREHPDDEFWTDWVAEDAARQETLNQAISLVKTIGGRKVTLSDGHIDRSIQQALQQAKRQEIEQKRLRWQPEIFRPTFRQSWAIAAAVLLVIGIGWLLFTTQLKQTVNDHQVAKLIRQGNSLRVVVNDRLPSQYVQLPDGSAVLLQKNSRISFPQRFSADKREVSLVGEAFFEVAKNPRQPFFVYANELVAKVLGTSFGVKAPADASDFVVVVKTGKVSVFTQSDRQANELKTSKRLTGLVLVPNDQVTFDRKESRLTQSAVEQPTLLNIPIERETFSYQETPVATLFADLEKAYGVRIDYDREVMEHCSITATLGDDPLIQKLDWICNVLEASYKMQDGYIQISGKSCQ